MISVQNISVEFGAKPLFDGANFVINKRDRIALVGKNGAGKTTLLNILAGQQNPTTGTVAVQNGITIGYLPQQMKLQDTRTVMEEVREAFSHIDLIHHQIEEINLQLTTRDDYESQSYHDLIDHLTQLNERLTIESGEGWEAEAEKSLIGLGFERTDFGRPTAEFSGGWRMRIELAKLLLRRPDVLLLDEPTNHLDIESIQWLEGFLKSKPGAVVVVSHDRAFIDNVTNRTIEISCGKLYDYNVNYSHFVELRRERVEQQTRAYLNQQKQIQDTEEFIERFRYKATKSVQVQSRIKQLAKIERIEIDEVDTSHINLKFPPAPRSGDYPLILDEVSKNYGDLHVFGGVTFTVKRGEKVAFVGKNGAGKSTLVKCIMGEIPFGGTLKIGHNVKIGYFAQNQAQLLDESLTVFDTIDRVAVGDIRTRIRDILGAFMFGGEASDKKVRVLSGGEKTRLAMIKMLLEPVNLLILDEPTNHLDMRTKDVLKDAIRAFDGTVVVVSHDREFLDGLVSKVYEFGHGHVREHLGGIYDFLEHKKMDSLRELEIEADAPVSKLNTNNKALQEKDGNKGKPVEKSANEQIGKISYAERRERERMVRRAQKRVDDCESEIALIEEQIKAIEETLAAGDNSDATVYDRHAALQKQIENAMSHWELACEELEEIKTNLL